MKNSDIIKAWIDGKSAKNKNMSTDGKILYSYELIIGITQENCSKIVREHRNPHDFVSMTTTKHVGEAMILADGSVIPQERLWK